MVVFLSDLKILTLLIWCCAILMNYSLTPIYALVYLIFVFIFAALLLFQLGFILLSYLYVIIYVGAISILFILALMVLNLRAISENSINIERVGLLFVLFFIFYFFIKFLYLDISLPIDQYLSEATILPYSTISICEYFYFFNYDYKFLLFLGNLDKLLGSYLYVYNYSLMVYLGLLLFMAIVFIIALVSHLKVSRLGVK